MGFLGKVRRSFSGLGQKVTHGLDKLGAKVGKVAGKVGSALSPIINTADAIRKGIVQFDTATGGALSSLPGVGAVVAASRPGGLADRAIGGLRKAAGVAGKVSDVAGKARATLQTGGLMGLGQMAAREAGRKLAPGVPKIQADGGDDPPAKRSLQESAPPSGGDPGMRVEVDAPE